MHSLPVFLKIEGRAVILVGRGEAVDAKRRLLERAGAIIVEESANASLAIVVDDESAVKRLQARGVLVNATDRPDLCDFTLPAIIDRDPVIIAIGTGGASAGLAKALRQRLEAILPPKLGALATALFNGRAAMRDKWPNASDRRRALDEALSQASILDPFRENAVEGVTAWLGNGQAELGDKLIHISLKSRDPDDLTLRSARLLGEADYLYHHPNVPEQIVNRARADAIRIVTETQPKDVGKGLSLWLEMTG